MFKESIHLSPTHCLHPGQSQPGPHPDLSDHLLTNPPTPVLFTVSLSPPQGQRGLSTTHLTVPASQLKGLQFWFFFPIASRTKPKLGILTSMPFSPIKFIRPSHPTPERLFPRHDEPSPAWPLIALPKRLSPSPPFSVPFRNDPAQAPRLRIQFSGAITRVCQRTLS